MLFYGYFWVAFISLDDFFKKYAYKTSKKIKFIGTTGRLAKRQAAKQQAAKRQTIEPAAPRHSIHLWKFC